MTVVKLRSDILRADRATADRWYITNGATAVGPVALELVERGVEAGKIPVESYIRHEQWKIWRPLTELCVTEAPRPSDATATPVIPVPLPLPADTGSFDPRRTTMKPAMAPPQPVAPATPIVVMEPASTRIPVSTSVPPVLSLETAEELDPDDVMEDPSRPRIPVLAPPSVEDITLPGGPPKTDEKVAAAPLLSGAAQLKDALLTLSGVILREVGCEGVMVHRVDDEGAVAVVAHGPRMFDVLGLRTRLLDPAIVAAAAGILVVAEPSPGPAGQSILSRLEKLGVNGSGAVMIPIRPHGRLFGTVELGQSAPFDGAAIAKAEGYVRVVQAKMEAADWHIAT